MSFASGHSSKDLTAVDWFDWASVVFDWASVAFDWGFLVVDWGSLGVDLGSAVLLVLEWLLVLLVHCQLWVLGQTSQHPCCCLTQNTGS